MIPQRQCDYTVHGCPVWREYLGTRWVYLSRYRGKPVSAESLRRIGELIRERMRDQ